MAVSVKHPGAPREDRRSKNRRKKRRLLRRENGAQPIHALQRHAAAARHAGQRVFGHQHRQAGFFGQQAVEVAQQRTAAGEHHAALGDVGAEFRRGLFERVFHRRDDLVERIGQRFENFVGTDGEAARHAFAQVSALDFHLLDLGAGKGRADFLLDGFGRGLADQHAVIAADVVDDGLVELVAAHAHTALVHRAAQRNDAHLSGAAADVDDHRAGGFADRQPGADGRSHGLFDEVHLAGARAQRRLANGAALDLGAAAGHANDDARTGPEHPGVVRHFDELLEHLLGHGEVGDHAVFHRADGLDIARHLAQHLLGFLAYGLNGFLAAGAALVADGDDRRLVEHDALAAHINERVGGAEVDGQIRRKILPECSEHGIWGRQPRARLSGGV